MSGEPFKPIKDYIKGREALQKGDRDEALRLISSSMGAAEPTPFMRESLDKLADMNDVALTLIVHNSLEDTDGRGL